MPNKDEIFSMAQNFQARTLNMQRKAFMDYQERDISPELRDRAVKMLKDINAGDYSAAAKEAETIVYLFKMLMIQNYITPQTFESLAGDGVALSVILKDITESGIEE